ncbi:zf-TFIIB domain-containing protein [Saezia sanguinis]|uniref:zf-TFIIB domain-containing protein n=1 Tax=Saezia sanguinis TaxID=1965230 RepID=UPI00304FF490
MKCPSCTNGELNRAYLDNLFACQTCDHCGGNWILLEHYLRWKDTSPEPLDAASAEDLDIEPMDSKQALVCPVSGALMLKYRISKDSSHRLDLSPDVGGIWLDKGEWEYLKKAGLAHQLNSIFTTPWQRKVRSESAKDTFEQMYRKKFGNEDYEKVKSVRAWLVAHPHRNALRAFLMAEDPWSAS